jgi:hypothetical protein
MPGRRIVLSLAAAAMLVCNLAAGASTPNTAMAAYGSEAEMVRALTRWREAAEKLRSERRRDASGVASMMQEAPAAPAAAAKSAADSAAPAAESITNVQTTGVDEGGIVKRAGDHLIILRRGRLFTVRVGGDTLQPASMVDAYAPGSNPSGAWYDELLVAGSTVVVVGYSYARGGTEIGLFELGADGALAHRATYHLRSFDYYSSRNYASRLIGRTLVFYTPTLLQPWGPRPWETMPALRRWHHDATPADFQRILPATRVYRTDDDFDPGEPLALHTVTRCELGAESMSCESTAVLGPAGRVFYVSAGSVYVWTTSWRRHPMPQPRTASAVFRIPLDGAAPTAIKTAGVPIDQMSFLEDGGHLNVLLREAGAGEGMWGSERMRGAMALLRLPLTALGDGRASAQREHYRRVPGPAGHMVQNRFVGDWLLWGGTDTPARAWALRFARGDEAVALNTEHGVERIEAMGSHALLVGNAAGDLHFSSVRLASDGAQIASRHVQPGARQGETRTHGFFHHATGSDEGLLGLPILGPGRGHHGVFAGAQGSASVLYLRQRDLAFSALGSLEAQPPGARDDGCKASCVDWYGNARPIFLGGRVFALLGYELVEGQLVRGPWRERIDERRRISFAPGATRRDTVYSPFN